MATQQDSPVQGSIPHFAIWAVKCATNIRKDNANSQICRCIHIYRSCKEKHHFQDVHSSGPVSLGCKNFERHLAGYPDQYLCRKLLTNTCNGVNTNVTGSRKCIIWTNGISPNEPKSG